MRHRAGGWLFAAGVVDQLLIAAILAWLWAADPQYGAAGVFVAVLLLPLWRFLHRYFGLYDSHRLDGWRSVVSATLTASTVGFLLVGTGLVITGMARLLPALAQFVALWVALALLSRGVIYNVLYILRRRGADRRYALIIGSWQKATELARQFRERPEWGLGVSIVGLGPPRDRAFYAFPGAGGESPPPPQERDLLSRDLAQILRDQVVDEILIAVPARELGTENEAVQLARRYGVQCRVCLGDDGDDLAPSGAEYIPGHLALTLHDRGERSLALTVKRVVDVALSAALLVLLSPVFLLLAVLVKLSSPGPVFYRQRRSGLRGREFVMLKFRTMVDGADAMLHLVQHRNITGGPIFKTPGDLRVTAIGRVLRRLSLDELPQLINVLRGDMSLVGPRPLPLHESVAITGEYRRRFAMKPGITCSWQVRGRSEIPFAQWMQLDVDYVDNWTLAEDLRLLLLTVPAVFHGKGAY